MGSEIYAPVVIFVYNREKEISELIESLSKDMLAKEHDVFIFSDGPRNSNDEIRVNRVRRFIDLLPGKGLFKNVTIKKAPVNKGLAESVIDGVSEIIGKYGKVIVLEDDLTVSKVFLTYMNKCLDFYEKDKRIWSISGHSPDIKSAKHCNKNIYLSYRASSTGWGTWRDRWELTDWNVRDYRWFSLNPLAQIRFCRGGNDLPGMLRAQRRGQIDSWAIRWCYSQSMHNMFSVAPITTFVLIGGYDGNGTHSWIGDKEFLYNEKTENSILEWCYDRLEVDRKIISELYEHFSTTRKSLILNELRYWKHRFIK